MSQRVLQLCHKPPFPSSDGGCLEMAKMSLYFDNSNQYDLFILNIHTDKHPYYPESFKQNIVSSQYDSVYVNTKINPFGALLKLIQNKSYHLSRFKHQNFEKKLIEVLQKNEFEFIVLESIFVGQYIDVIKQYSQAKVVLNSPNIEFEIWERLAINSGNPLKKIYLKKLAKQLKKEENYIYNKIDAIIAITDKDLRYYQNHFPSKPSITIPFLLDLGQYKIDKKEIVSPIKFYHIGSMDWLPNIEGIEWFLNEVWEKKFSKNQNIQFSFAGKRMPTAFYDYRTTKNIKVAGFVDNAKDFINANDVMIVPLKSGSGLRVKILEGMALGKAIITTAIGAEGINCEHHKNILIANDENEFYEQINFLIENTSKIEEIGNNARKLVEEQYNSVILEKTIPNFFNSINE